MDKRRGEEVDRVNLPNYRLYTIHGNKWEKIGKLLERTSTNVKDKFKQMGGRNYDKRTNEMTLLQCLKMLKYIQDYLSSDEEEFKLFKYIYKFSSNVEKKTKQLYKIYEQEEKIKLDESVKGEQNRLIIKNILKMLIDVEKLKEIVFDDVEISWSFIAQKMKSLSSDDCRSKWGTILKMFNLDKRYQISRDLKMINK
jgi:hypothetical protein